MAILGVGGRLELQRTPPAPLQLAEETYNPVNRTIAPTVDCNWQHWWTGDEVAIVYYDDAGTPVASSRAFLCVDELRRISFYPTKCSGMRCERSDRLALGANVPDYDYIEVYPSGDEPYENAKAYCSIAGQGEYEYYDVIDSIYPGDIPINPDDPRYDSMCEHPPLYEVPIAGIPDYDNADIQPRPDIGFSEDFGPYKCVADIREWSLELDAPAVDTTGVGDKFGEAVKSLISGGGTIDFLVDRACHPELEEPEVLMQLLLMTKQGAEANAKFYLVDTAGGDCVQVPGSLYYECKILITRNAINLRPTEVVACTASFVTTEEVKLLMHGA